MPGVTWWKLTNSIMVRRAGRKPTFARPAASVSLGSKRPCGVAACWTPKRVGLPGRDGPQLTYGDRKGCCGAASPRQTFRFSTNAFHLNALMRKLNDRNLFALDLSMGRLAAKHCLKISQAAQRRTFSLSAAYQKPSSTSVSSTGICRIWSSTSNLMPISSAIRTYFDIMDRRSGSKILPCASKASDMARSKTPLFPEYL